MLNVWTLDNVKWGGWGIFYFFVFFRNVDKINSIIWRGYFSFFQGVKSANSELFKDFCNEAEMEKNGSNCGSYSDILTETNLWHGF